MLLPLNTGKEVLLGAKVVLACTSGDPELWELQGNLAVVQAMVIKPWHSKKGQKKITELWHLHFT